MLGQGFGFSTKYRLLMQQQDAAQESLGFKPGNSRHGACRIFYHHLFFSSCKIMMSVNNIRSTVQRTVRHIDKTIQDVEPRMIAYILRGRMAKHNQKPLGATPPLGSVLHGDISQYPSFCRGVKSRNFPKTGNSNEQQNMRKFISLIPIIE